MQHRQNKTADERQPAASVAGATTVCVLASATHHRVGHTRTGASTVEARVVCGVCLLALGHTGDEWVRARSQGRETSCGAPTGTHAQDNAGR